MTVVGLWKHQEEGAAAAIEWITKRAGGGAGGAFWWGVRSGKTGAALGVVDGLNARRVLVIAPRAVVEDERTWWQAVQRHLPSLDVLELTKGATKQRAEALARFGNGMVTLTWDSMWREPLDAAIRAWGPDLVVSDEAHMGQTPSSRRAKFLLPLARTVEARLSLSGTPMGQSPMGVWAPYQVLVPGGALFPPTFSQFRARYAFLVPVQQAWDRERHKIAKDIVVETGRGGDLKYWRLRDLDEMSERMYRCASRIRTEDVIDQTPATSETLHVRLEPEAQRIYRELDKEFLTEISEGVLSVVSNAAAKVMRLQQVTGGALDDETGVNHVVSEAKERRLAEWLETVGDEPVVVFARFHHDLDAIHAACRRAGLTSGELSGRRRELTEWKAAETQVLAVQEQVGGAGIDLTRARLCVYYSLSHSLLDYDQSVGRVRGPMQKRSVGFYYLVVGGSVDEDILDALEARAEVFDFVVERGRHRRAAIR